MFKCIRAFPVSRHLKFDGKGCVRMPGCKAHKREANFCSDSLVFIVVDVLVGGGQRRRGPMAAAANI